MSTIFKHVAMHPSIFGSYTELFVGLSPKVTIEKSSDRGKFQPSVFSYQNEC